jgi:hypothetical protein
MVPREGEVAWILPEGRLTTGGAGGEGGVRRTPVLLTGGGIYST